MAAPSLSSCPPLIPCPRSPSTFSWPPMGLHTNTIDLVHQAALGSLAVRLRHPLALASIPHTTDLVDHAVGSLAVRLRHPLASGSNASFPARNSNAGESWPTWNEVTRTRPETLKRWPLLLVSLDTFMHTGGRRRAG